MFADNEKNEKFPLKSLMREVLILLGNIQSLEPSQVRV